MEGGRVRLKSFLLFILCAIPCSAQQFGEWAMLVQGSGGSNSNPSNYVDVCSSGCDYTSIGPAITYVTSQTPTQAAPWIIEVYSGEYHEGALTIPSYTYIRGIDGTPYKGGDKSVRIKTSLAATPVTSGNWITLDEYAYLENVYLDYDATQTGHVNVVYAPGFGATITNSRLEYGGDPSGFSANVLRVAAAINMWGSAVEGSSLTTVAGSSPVAVESTYRIRLNGSRVISKTTEPAIDLESTGKVGLYGDNQIFGSFTSTLIDTSSGGTIIHQVAANDEVSGEILMAGDLSGDGDLPQVVDDSHAHTTATVSGLVEADMPGLLHFSPTAGLSTDHGAGSVAATTDLSAALCGTGEILEDQGASWACITTPSGGGGSFLPLTGGTLTGQLNVPLGSSTTESIAWPTGGGFFDPNYGLEDVHYSGRLLGGSSTSAWGLYNANVSSTQPTVLPDKRYSNSGLGGGVRTVALVADGKQVFFGHDSLVPSPGIPAQGFRSSTDSQLHVSMQSTQTDNGFEVANYSDTVTYFAVEADFDVVVGVGDLYVSAGKATIGDIVSLTAKATAPATCSADPMDIYSDTSGALCVCTSANNWTNISGFGSCV